MRRDFSAALAVVLALMPATGLAQEPDVPTRLPPALVDQHFTGLTVCEPFADLPHGDYWEIHELTGDYLLYMVPCTAGAYNYSYMFYVAPAGNDHFQRLLFVDYSDRTGWIGTDYLFGAFFDPETLTLSSFYKGRGLADCGTAGVWRWDEYAFRLEAFYAQEECNGTIEPGNFPQIWPPPEAAAMPVKIAGANVTDR